MTTLAAIIFAAGLTGAAGRSQSADHQFRGKGPEYWHWRYVREHRLSTRLGERVRQLQADGRRKFRRDVAYALRLASSTFGVSLRELYAVARCETGGSFSPNSRNPQSTASGVFQFLDSTWAAQGMRGFSVFDPYANALAAARIVRREGWRQWSCQP